MSLSTNLVPTSWLKISRQWNLSEISDQADIFVVRQIIRKVDFTHFWSDTSSRDQEVYGIVISRTSDYNGVVCNAWQVILGNEVLGVGTPLFTILYNKQSCRPFYYNVFYWLVYTAASLIVGLSYRLHMRYEEEGRQFDCFGRKEIENAQDISG